MEGRHNCSYCFAFDFINQVQLKVGRTIGNLTLYSNAEFTRYTLKLAAQSRCFYWTKGKKAFMRRSEVRITAVVTVLGRSIHELQARWKQKVGCLGLLPSHSLKSSAVYLHSFVF